MAHPFRRRVCSPFEPKLGCWATGWDLDTDRHAKSLSRAQTRGSAVGAESQPGRGKAERRADPKQIDRLRSRIGMVFQSFNLWSHKTILENVIEAPIHVQS